MAENTNPQPNQTPAPEAPAAPMQMPTEQVVTPGAEQKAPDAPSEGTSGGGHMWLSITIGIIIIVVVLALGGLYLWGAKLAGNDAMMENDKVTEEGSMEGDGTMAADAENTMETQDSVEAIEADLGADVDSIDAELDAIDAELDAELGA